MHACMHACIHTYIHMYICVITYILISPLGSKGWPEKVWAAGGEGALGVGINKYI